MGGGLWVLPPWGFSLSSACAHETSLARIFLIVFPISKEDFLEFFSFLVHLPPPYYPKTHPLKYTCSEARVWVMVCFGFLGALVHLVERERVNGAQWGGFAQMWGKNIDGPADANYLTLPHKFYMWIFINATTIPVSLGTCHPHIQPKPDARYNSFCIHPRIWGEKASVLPK